MTILYGPRDLLGTPLLLTASTVLLDAAGDKAGAVFVAPKDGTIDRLAVYCTAVAGTVPTYTIQLEGVTAGAPSGSAIAANTNGTFVPTASTLHVITLTASYVVAAGELIAITLNAAAATAGNNATFNLRYTPTVGPTFTHYPRALTDLSVGTWSQANNNPMLSPVYSDGAYFRTCMPRCTNTATTFSNASAPDERGNRFTQVGSFSCVGAGIYIRGTTAGDNFNVKLYPTTADNSAPIATFAGTASNYFFSTSITGIALVYWDAVDLVDGTDYRLTVQPSTANTLATTKCLTDSEAVRQTASHFYQTTRTRTADGDDGAWTDTNTDFEMIWPLYSQSNAAAGGSVASIFSTPVVRGIY